MAHMTQGSVQYLDSGFWTRLWIDEFWTNVELYNNKKNHYLDMLEQPCMVCMLTNR